MNDQIFREKMITQVTRVATQFEDFKDVSAKKHMENTENFRKIFEIFRCLECSAHNERIKANKGNILFNRWAIWTVIIGGVVLGLWVGLAVPGG
tara:strand:- start:10037 stop:10318 length:282 start_codon:yes stop_codon:yes gene_type:complete